MSRSIYIIYTGCERIINGVTSRERKGKDVVVGEVRENSLANYLDSVVNYAHATRKLCWKSSAVVVRIVKKTFTLKHLNTNIQFNLSDRMLPPCSMQRDHELASARAKRFVDPDLDRRDQR